MADGVRRTGTRRISSWPGEQTLHQQAGYIDADFLHPPTFPLQSDGGPYISVTCSGVAADKAPVGAKSPSHSFRTDEGNDRRRTQQARDLAPCDHTIFIPLREFHGVFSSTLEGCLASTTLS